jgi:hypothetical protein
MRAHRENGQGYATPKKSKFKSPESKNERKLLSTLSFQLLAEKITGQ